MTDDQVFTVQELKKELYVEYDFRITEETDEVIKGVGSHHSTIDLPHRMRLLIDMEINIAEATMSMKFTAPSWKGPSLVLEFGSAFTKRQFDRQTILLDSVISNCIRPRRQVRQYLKTGTPPSWATDITESEKQEGITHD